MDKIEQVREKFVEFVGNFGAGFGLSSLTTQLYALLYLSPKPLSLDDMVKQLHVSKGSVSVNIRILQEWRAVKKVLRMGSRKDYYEADTDVFKIVVNRLRSGLKRRLDEVNEGIKNMENILNETSGDSQDAEKMIQVYKTKLQEVKKMSEKADSLLKFTKFPLL